MNKKTQYCLIFITAFTFQGCSSSSGDNDPNEVTERETDTGFSIGGDVTGLNGDSFIIQNNNADDTTIYKNGAYVLFAKYSDQSEFNLSIVKQPIDPNQSCQLSYESGNIDGEDIVDVDIDCINVYTIGGEVVNLGDNGPIYLANNFVDFLEITGDGTFVFEQAIPDGDVYEVYQTLQPPQVQCNIVDNIGIVNSAPVTNILIDCSQLAPVPVPVPVGPSPEMKAFLNDLYAPYLRNYCSGCHQLGGSGAGLFADSDPERAYREVLPRIDRNDASQSLLVTRVQNGHNCWSNCEDNANDIQSGISGMLAAGS